MAAERATAGWDAHGAWSRPSVHLKPAAPQGVMDQVGAAAQPELLQARDLWTSIVLTLSSS